MSQEITQYVRPADAARLLGMGVSTIWGRAKTDPEFPKAIKFGARTTVFRRSELLAWAESRAAQPASGQTAKAA